MNDETICPICKKNSKLKSMDMCLICKQKQKIEKTYSYNSELKTAKDMYNYAVKNNLGKGLTDKWGIKHFKIIENSLLDGEKVLLPFIGSHNYFSMTKHDNNFAYALTNKRFIMAQKNIIAGETVQSVYLENINDITYQSKISIGIMTVDTIKETFNIGLEKSNAKNIFAKVQEILNNLKNNKKTNNSNQNIDKFDEIKKYKELLDENIITEEEFEKKKNELLNN